MLYPLLNGHVRFLAHRRLLRADLALDIKTAEADTRCDPGTFAAA